jgi:hypothetical protein
MTTLKKIIKRTEKAQKTPEDRTNGLGTALYIAGIQRKDVPVASEDVLMHLESHDLKEIDEPIRGGIALWVRALPDEIKVSSVAVITSLNPFKVIHRDESGKIKEEPFRDVNHRNEYHGQVHFVAKSSKSSKTSQ